MRNISILYVEDEKSVREFVKIIFHKHGLENIFFADDGDEALLVYNDSFDLVITDMVMPGMSGFELIEKIKEINPHQIFMMVTGLDSKEDLIRAINLKVSFFVQKPIKPKKFVQVLEDAAEKINQKKELKLSNLLLSQYKKAIDASAIVSKTDLCGRITYVNPMFCEISKYTSEELIGKSHNIVRSPDTPKEIYEEMWDMIQSKHMWSGLIKNRAKDGSEYIVDSTIMPLLNTDDTILEYIAIRRDVTQLEHSKEELEAQLHLAIKEIIDTQKEVVYTMGSIGETRSKETGNHVKRVAEFSYLLAKLSGLSEEEAQLLKLASPMHDIGKVGIPDEILNKPGKLTPEEFEIMKTHALLGYEMLKGSNRDVMKTSAIVASEHHERYDGHGYPYGLKGEEIHIYGRITTICDVFDALGADRCYKKAWELERILALFKEERGKQFDPDLVDIFFENLDDFLVIRDKYADL